MAAKKEYEAILALGARLQSSFGGAFGAAKRQLQNFGNAAKSIGKMFAPLWRGIQFGLGMLAAHAVTNVFQKIFGGAEEAAKAALQRTQQLTAALSSQPQLQKLGKDVIEGQVLALQKVSAELGKVGVVHSDHYEQASRTLALYGVAPKKIGDMLPVLGDTLVATKGVNASVEAMQDLVGGVTKAIGTGQTKALASVGILMDANQKKAFQAMNATQRQTKLVEILTQKYKGANEAAVDTDLGKIQRFQNMMAAFSETIGKEMIPVQARFAEFWTEVLPRIEPIAKTVFAAVSGAMGDTAAFAREVVVPAIEGIVAYFRGDTFSDMIGHLSAAFSELMRAIQPVTDALGFTGLEAKSFAEFVGDLVTGSLMAFTISMKAAAAIITGMGDAWNWIGEVSRLVTQFFGGLAGQIQSALAGVQEALARPFLDAIKTVLEAWNALVSAISNFKMPDIGGAIKGAWNWVTGQKAPGAQYGGIFRRPAVRQIAEAGVPEAVIPLQRSARSRGLLGAAAEAIGPAAGGGSMMSRTTLNFNPQIEIAGNADKTTVTELDRSLRALADDFLGRFNQAQEQERRLAFST